MPACFIKHSLPSGAAGLDLGGAMREMEQEMKKSAAAQVQLGWL